MSPTGLYSFLFGLNYFRQQKTEVLSKSHERSATKFSIRIAQIIKKDYNNFIIRKEKR